MQKLFCILYFVFFISSFASAEEGTRYLHPSAPAYDYLDYLINSGQLTPQFALRQPWEMDRDLQLNGKDPVQKFLQTYHASFYRKGQARFYIDASERLKYTDQAFGRFHTSGGVAYFSDHITLFNRTEVDQDYKRDPLFAGDLSEAEGWLYGRVNEAWINLNAGGFDLFFGRTWRNWGPVDEKSLLLSDHPYTYDHLILSYTSGRLKISVIYAQLENRNALISNHPDPGSTEVKNARRHLVGHRLDFRLMDRLQIGLTEMATYGGEDRDFEPSFMNPVNFYYPLQRNDRKFMSGYWMADLFFKPLDKLTLYGQFLIDDVIVNNDPGVDDRAQFPDRFAVSTSLRAADILGRLSNLSLGYTRVWNRTYQSRFTYENYHYRELGLGYPCASCEEVKLTFSLWRWFPLWIKSETIYGRYGDVRFTDLFPLKHENFPIAPARHNLYNKIHFNYEYSPSARLFFSAQYLHHPDHYLNRINDRSKWVLNLGLRVLLSGGVRVEEVQ